VWNNPSLPPPSNFSTKTPVHVFSSPVNSLNNRYHVYDMIETEGVLMLDDDNFLSPATIDGMFQVWRRHPDSMISRDARVH